MYQVPKSKQPQCQKSQLFSLHRTIPFGYFPSLGNHFVQKQPIHAAFTPKSCQKAANAYNTPNPQLDKPTPPDDSISPARKLHVKKLAYSPSSSTNRSTALLASSHCCYRLFRILDATDYLPIPRRARQYLRRRFEPRGHSDEYDVGKEVRQ